ncbi:hypothetical protein SISNIDRAFT_470471 [Sistotremastrum niveocremeum HHB9708]|uniref:DUF6535 domain-containing protein n=1 Tax=Sistotremastrum niveocremeum HHB9708 TaxID=1314777 RepID=A0A164NSJ9_9AGAM|nr:hypothetical protein SISNIDRAFT_470471 [Sistotremastrum niveocremeum HHB9708]
MSQSVITTDTANDPFDTPAFRKLLVLVEAMSHTMEDQNKAILEQKKTMDLHTEIFQGLKANSTKGEQPYTLKPWYDPAGWRAIWQSATTHTKEQAEEWKTRMDVSLVFIAIYSTIQTAFLVPAAQGLSKPIARRNSTSALSNSSFIQANCTSNASYSGSDLWSASIPVPPVADQVAYMFFQLALVLSILNAISCVLARQWAGQLLRMRDASTYVERTMRHEDRKKIVTRWLGPLIDNILHWTSLTSLALFCSGLLFQTWSMSLSFSGSVPILIATCEISSFLIILAWITITAMFVHAVLDENSPFVGPSSLALRWALGFPIDTTERYTAAIEKDEHRADEHLLGTETPQNEKQLQERLRSREEAVETYARLVSEIEDPDLLDKAAPALQFKEWISVTSKSSLDPFLAAYARLTSTDNSPQVKATMNQHIIHFSQWLHQSWSSLKIPVDKISIMKWCQDECGRLTMTSDALRRTILPTFGFFASFSSSTRSLNDLSRIPFDQCIIRILCAFDTDSGAGINPAVFWAAVDEWSNVRQDAESSGILETLSENNRLAILRSILRYPSESWSTLPHLAKELVKGHESQILDGLAPFLTNLPKVESASGALLVIDLLEAFLIGLPSGYQFPSNLSLSRILSVASRHIPRANILFYLEHSSLSQISDIPSLLQFLQLCTESPSDWDPYQPRDPQHLKSIHKRALSVRSRVLLLHKRVKSCSDANSALRFARLSLNNLLEFNSEMTSSPRCEQLFIQTRIGFRLQSMNPAEQNQIRLETRITIRPDSPS